MVPATVVRLDGPLPLTPNGKLDRRALPAVDWAALTGDEAPSTPEQRRVASLFAEVLGLPAVGVHDNFFALGGHSMAAMRLVGRLRSAFTADLSIRDVFDAPTVATLASRLSSASLTRPALVRRSSVDPRPAPVQAQWTGRPSPDHEFIVTWPDRAALEAALADVVDRHAPLRTPVGGVLPLQTSFSSDGLRLSFWYTGVDEWSVVPLFRDLHAAYTARSAGSEPCLPPLPVSYSDYAAWAHELLGSPSDPDSVWSRQLRFWQRTIDSIPVTEPGDSAAGVLDVVLTPSLHAAIDALASRTGTSLFMVLQAALARLLTRRGAGSDLAIGTLVAGRAEEQLVDLVGCFFNTIVLRTRTQPNFVAMLGEIRESNLDALDHQELPYSALASRPPSVMLIHHEQASLGSGGGITALPYSTATSDLTFACYESPAGQPVHCYLQYRTAAYSSSTIDSMAQELVAILEEETR